MSIVTFISRCNWNDHDLQLVSSSAPSPCSSSSPLQSSAVRKDSFRIVSSSFSGSIIRERASLAKLFHSGIMNRFAYSDSSLIFLVRTIMRGRKEGEGSGTGGADGTDGTDGAAGAATEEEAYGSCPVEPSTSESSTSVMDETSPPGYSLLSLTPSTVRLVDYE